jgi:hypothetical protein
MIPTINSLESKSVLRVERPTTDLRHVTTVVCCKKKLAFRMYECVLITIQYVERVGVSKLLGCGCIVLRLYRQWQGTSILVASS